MTAVNWTRLEIGVPVGEGDTQLLIDGRTVTAREFHRELVRLDHAVFTMTMAEERHAMTMAEQRDEALERR
jgi:hypothetical protein